MHEYGRRRSQESTNLRTLYLPKTLTKEDEQVREKRTDKRVLAAATLMVLLFASGFWFAAFNRFLRPDEGGACSPAGASRTGTADTGEAGNVPEGRVAVDCLQEGHCGPGELRSGHGFVGGSASWPSAECPAPSWRTRTRVPGIAGTGRVAVKPFPVTSSGQNPPLISSRSPDSERVVGADSQVHFCADCWDPDGAEMGYEWAVDGEAAPSQAAVMDYTVGATCAAPHRVTLTVRSGGGQSTASWLLEPVRSSLPAAAETADYPPIVRGRGYAIATDTGGNRYIVGQFSGSGVDFNPTSGADTKSSAGGWDAFVTRFNADGSYGWTQTFGGSGDETACGVAVSGGVVYVAGEFSSPDAGVGGAGAIGTIGNEDCFVLALDAATGAAKTAFSGDGVQVFGGSQREDAEGITVSGGVVYVTGEFRSPNAGIGGAGGLSSLGDADCFVLALDAATGAARTSFSGDGIQVFGGSDDEMGEGLVAAGNKIYVVGKFSSSDAGVGSTGSIATAGGYDIFVLALSTADGSAFTPFSGDGVQTFGGTGDDLGDAGIAWSGGVLYVAGGFASSDAGIGGTGTVSVVGDEDCFVLALDALSGAAKTSFGGDGVVTFGGSMEEEAESVAVSGGVVYVTGYFTSSNAGIDGAGSVASAGGFDCFVLALDSSDGSAETGFGSDGIVVFGGTGDDGGFGIVVSDGVIWVGGRAFSADAKLDGTGDTYNGSSWLGLLLPLNGDGTLNADDDDDDDDDDGGGGGGGSGGGGGCSLHPARADNLLGWSIPYLAVALLWLLSKVSRGFGRAVSQQNKPY